jgi:lipoprotein-anchoring transpeptidase ErfK/SrfK
MWRSTAQAANGKRKIEARVRLLVVAAALCWVSQALGNDQPPAPSGSKALPVATSRHILLISIPDRKLAFIEDGRVMKVYPVAVGRTSTPSPIGTMRISNKVVTPTYYHKGRVIRPGKTNPLGNRWIGLNEKGYGIHGTNEPSSIGKAASHGCFRMRQRDVEELFKLVRVGDMVEIHGKRDRRVSDVLPGSFH